MTSRVVLFCSGAKLREARKVKGAAGGWVCSRGFDSIMAHNQARSGTFGCSLAHLHLPPSSLSSLWHYFTSRAAWCFGTPRSPQRARNSKEPAQKKIALDLFCRATATRLNLAPEEMEPERAHTPRSSISLSSYNPSACAR